MAVGAVCDNCGKIAPIAELKADPYPWLTVRWVDNSTERHYCQPSCVAEGAEAYNGGLVGDPGAERGQPGSIYELAATARITRTSLIPLTRPTPYVDGG